MNNQYFVGVDMGYGYFKYFSQDGWGAIKSAAANGYQVSTSLLLDDEEGAQYNDVDVVYINDEPVAIGEQALGWLNRLDSTRSDFHRSPAALALLQASLLQATRQTGARPASVNITLALPGANFATQKGALLKWLDAQGDLWRVRFIDSAGRSYLKTFTIQSKEVIPQPQAHLLGLWMTAKGGIRNTRRALARTVIIDLGAGTCDMGLFKSLKPHGELTSPAGGWQMVRSFEKAVKERLPNYSGDRFDLDEVIQGNGEIFFGGEIYDMSDVVDKTLTKAAGSIANHLTATVPNAMNIANVLLVGGWGERLYPYIQQHIPHTTLVTELFGKNGDWKNELPHDMPAIGLAARGCYCYMMLKEAKRKRKAAS